MPTATPRRRARASAATGASDAEPVSGTATSATTADEGHRDDGLRAPVVGAAVDHHGRADDVLDEGSDGEDPARRSARAGRAATPLRT